jgi:branched-subunit amino acid ABC-type transport system permease component
VLQYIVLATAWNILGGYTGYINFGTGAFFAIGAYSTVVLHNLHAKPALLQDWFGIGIPAVPLPVMILVGGIVAGLVGLGTGYLTLRLRGVFFAIATLALAVVVQTLIVNWDYVGGSRGTYVIRPAQAPLGGGYIQYLYTLMMALTVISVAIARTIERSRLGLGFAAIRDDEQAAEAGGVPTLRLKLIATTLSGGLMGMAGAPPALLRDLYRAVLGVQPILRGQQRRDAGGRRDDALGRPDHRRGAARDNPAIGHGDDLVGAQSADRGVAADLLCRDRAERHCRPGDGAAAQTQGGGGNCRSAGNGPHERYRRPGHPYHQRPGKTLRRVCRARQYQPVGRVRRAARADRARTARARARWSTACAARCRTRPAASCSTADRSTG